LAGNAHLDLLLHRFPAFKGSNEVLDDKSQEGVTLALSGARHKLGDGRVDLGEVGIDEANASGEFYE
jgi:hypothetical protein